MTGTGPELTVVPPLIDLRGLLAGLRMRRRWWMGLAVVGLLFGTLTGLALPGAARATTRVYVVEAESGGSGDTQMKTAVVVLESSTVAAGALQRLGSTENPEDFLRDYTGESSAPNVLDITATGRTDAEAIARTQAIADAFIADHIARSNSGNDAVVAAIRARQDQLKAELAQLDTAGTPGTRAGTPDTNGDARARIQSQIDGLQQQLEQNGIGSPQVAAGTRILDVPHSISRSIVTRAGLAAALGLVLGLGAGLAVAAVAAVVGDRPVLRKEVALHLGASIVAQVPRRRRLSIRPSRRTRGEYERTVASVVRLTASAPGRMALLEIGCPRTALTFAADVADGLSAEGPVALVVDVPGHAAPSPAGGAVTVLDGNQFPPRQSLGDQRVLAVASLRHGTPWLDLPRLGEEALLLVRAGSAGTTWLHTVARQLADAGILVAGIVIVDPDPRDRSDGTLWNGMHAALRGRAEAVPAPPLRAVAEPVVTPSVPIVGLPQAGPVTRPIRTGVPSRPITGVRQGRPAPAVSASSTSSDPFGPTLRIPLRPPVAPRVDDTVPGRLVAPPAATTPVETPVPVASPTPVEAAASTSAAHAPPGEKTVRVTPVAPEDESTRAGGSAPVGVGTTDEPDPADGADVPEPATPVEDTPVEDAAPVEETAEAESNSDEPAEVHEPVAVDVSADVEEPAGVDGSAAVDGSAEVEESAAVEESATVDESAVDESADVEERVAVEEPAETEEPAAVAEPRAEEEPAAAEAVATVTPLSAQDTVRLRPIMLLPSIAPVPNGTNGSGTSGNHTNGNGTNGNGAQPATESTDDDGDRQPRVPAEKRRRPRPPLRGLRTADRPGDPYRSAAHPGQIKEGETR